MATPAQTTNGQNKYYKDSGNNVFESGTNRAIALPEFQSLGLNIDHINPQVDTSQPNPATVSAGLQKVPTQSLGPDGKPIYDVFAGGQHVSDPDDPRLKGVNIDTLQSGTAPQGFQSKFQKGFEQANSATGAQVPSGSQGSAIVNQYAPPKTNDIASAFTQTDPYFEGLVSAFQKYISPENQRASLADTYKTMLKDSGIEAIDMELINTKNIIEGSEDDIRTEITKAGGFATDSQVLALTNSRNKQLIKNYNTLLDTRNSKESYLKTSIQLEQADRESADKRFESSFNMGMEIAKYGETMKQNAITSLDRTKGVIGWSGIAEATKNDPYTTRLVEKTYGLPAGGLQMAVKQEQLLKSQAEEKRLLELDEKKLGMQLKGEQILTEKAQRANIYSQISDRSSSPNNSTLNGNVQNIVASNPQLQGLPSEQQNNAVLTALLKNKNIGQGTRTKVADVLGVLTATESLANSRQTTGFKGVSPFNNILDNKFFGIGLPFRNVGKSKESIENAGYIDAINLKVQQWASGSSLTSEQIKQVERFTPKMTDSDSSVRTKLNNLHNFMQEQAKSQLQSEGIAYVPNKVNLFEAYDLLQKASPEQKKLLREQGLIK